MRDLDSAVVTALAARGLVFRDFIWIEARDRITGDIVGDGQWSDIGPTTVQVIDPNTGGPTTRTYYGSGTLTKVADVILTSTISVQPATITMSQVHNRVNDLLRGYDVKLAPVQMHRGLFSLTSRQLVAPAVVRFVGYVDNVKFHTPAEGGDGSVEVVCNSHTQELLRSNPELRSHESQIKRFANDSFYKDTHVVSLWEHFWGKASGRVPATAGAGAKSK